jgi:hypothetical protein
VKSETPRPFVVRVPLELRARAQSLAEQRGCTLTEVIRQALNREVELASSLPVSEVNPNGAMGKRVSAIVDGAARGDLACQRELFLDRFAALQSVGADVPWRMLLHMEIIALGRFIACHRHEADIRKLAGALLGAARDFRRFGFREIGNGMMTECLSVLEQLAEGGSDLAAICSERLIDDEPTTESIEAVREYRRNAEREDV